MNLSLPKGGTNAILLFLSIKFNFCQKKSATKFLCVKTSSYKVVATSLPYLMVHRWIGATSPSTKNVHSKWPTPSENTDFDKFRLIVHQTWELVKKVQSSLRKSTIRFPSSYRWTMCVNPKSAKGWLKTRIFTRATLW